ncbi:MAG: cellulase family glycosylhydrolase, partial [Clostridia bacterium]|nr:cellulase family glycosylhydrolase [Clostridia bacterium]
MNHISKKFFTGINYWGSGNAINMWEQFDAASIETDLKLLSSVGITHLRVFPLWPIFQPLHAVYGPNHVYEYAFGESPLPDTPAGKAGVSEEACQHFQTFCQLAEQYGMRLIVALITGHMSFRTYAPPAFEGKALLSDPTVIKWQRRFVKYFVTRFKDESIIIGWDLGNEVINMPGLQGLHPDAFSVWCGTIADAIRSCDSSRPIISGLDHASVEAGACNLRMIGEICDINTVHPYNIFSTASDPLNTMQPILDLPFQCQLSEDVAKIPTFVQEFGSIGYMNCSEKTEADFYRACLLTTLTHGCHGTMWWCAFDQGHFDYAPYRWNTIGSDYGFFTRELKAKPVARENLEFQDLLRALPGGTLPKHTTNATVLIPRDDGGADIPLLRTTYILAKQANIDVCFRYILDPIPESSLYIIPSIKTNKALPKDRLDCLLEKVREGSVLYLCAHKGLIRQLPTMTGVTFSYREEINREKTLNLQGSLLPITTHYFYQPESTSAEIVGVDEAGEGVFFKYAYGKGWVYLLTLPLEAALSEKKG